MNDPDEIESKIDELIFLLLMSFKKCNELLKGSDMNVLFETIRA